MDLKIYQLNLNLVIHLFNNDIKKLKKVNNRTKKGKTKNSTEKRWNNFSETV